MKKGGNFSTTSGVGENNKANNGENNMNSTNGTGSNASTAAVLEMKRSRKHRKLDLRAWVLSHLNAVIGVVVVILLISASYGGFSYYQNKQEQKASSAVFAFRKGTWVDYTQGKIKDDELLNKWQELQASINHSSSSVVIMGIEMGDYLIEKHKAEVAEKILTPMEKYKINPNIHYFLAMNLAVIYEDQGKIKEAIAQLEGLLSSKMKLGEARVYFDLARLYQREGNKEKARANYQYIVDNFSRDSLVRLAKIYLQNL